MGNVSSSTVRTGGALDSYVSELGADIVYEKSLGTSRFLKAVRGRHRNGPVAIKIFIKHEPTLSLRSNYRKLKAERETLADIPNVYNYQAFLETERAGYTIRQWVSNNLYDRISTRPFLSLIEKKWIAFQLISGMKEVRAHKVSHGDIKSENILVTSWNWVYITDFASFKPVYLPEDDPADYSYYFDTSGRRTCYIAPERFYSEKDGLNEREASVTEAMDVFSLGCVLAELFLEGRDTFTLSQLFKYRAGELNMDSHLGTIEDQDIRALITQMIALDPTSRPSFESLLNTARGATFPEVFYSFLHNYVQSINQTSSPSPFAKQASTRMAGNTEVPHAGAGSNPENWSTIPTDSDHRIERIWTEFDSLESLLAGGDNRTEALMEVKPEVPRLGRAYQDILPVEVHIPNLSSQLKSTIATSHHAAAEDGPALIILSLVCANIRNCTLPSSRIKALDILLALASFLTDESKLDRVVPYIVELLRDDAALVRASAIRALTHVVTLVSAITASNASLFPEYILPNVRYLTHDTDVMVRAMYAQCIVPLAETSVRFLEMSQAIKTHGAVDMKGSQAQNQDVTFEEDSYDTRLYDLHKEMEEQIVGLLVDSSPVVKRAVLHDTPALCLFIGRQKTNDVLLSHMITYLNDRDWMLRYAFFDSIVGVAAAVGGRSLEEYILPLMIQALSDAEETVVAKVLSSLTSLAELGLFQKLRIWELMSAATGFLYHPNIWIREGAAAFITSSSKHLPATDVWCILYPSLRPLLRSDIRHITDQSLLLTVKSHLSRPVFDAAVAWAMKAEHTLFWSPQHSRNRSRFETPVKDEPLKSKNSTPAVPRSEDDDVQFQRLEQMGMAPGDETKLVILRDYILKLAQTTQSFTSRLPVEIGGAPLTAPVNVELQKLGIVPRTVFLNNRESPAPTTAHHPDTIKRLGSSGERRTSSFGLPRTSRASSFDHASSTSVRDAGAYTDLRRKLAQMDTSLLPPNTPQSPDARNLLSPRPSEVDSDLRNLSGGFSPRPPSSVADTEVSRDNTSHPPRPPSPSGESMRSIQTTGVHTTIRTSKRGIHVGEGPKAAAAVGSINTNVSGVMEASVKLRADLEADDPLASTPPSIAGTVRKEGRSKALPPPAPTTYEGQEPAIANVLEHVYQDNFRQGVHDFGPRISHGPIRRRQPMRTTFPPRENGGGQRPDPTLVANLTAHNGAINALTVSPDHVFFVSASDDKTVKVWDTARLERNVTSKPRHTYTQHHARVTCLYMLEASHCFISAAEDGSLHVVRVHVSVSGSLPKYGKLQVVREHRTDHPGEYITCLTHFNSDNSSTLIYTTTHASIVVLDLRTMRVLQTMANPVHYGAITSICVDPLHTCLIVGTQEGLLTLWDLRFGLLLRSWRVGGSVRASTIHPTMGRGRLIFVAIAPRPLRTSGPSSSSASRVLVEVWDFAKAALVETFVTREMDDESNTEFPDSLPRVESESQLSPQMDTTSAADAIAAYVREHQRRIGIVDSGTPPASLLPSGPGTTTEDSELVEARTIRPSSSDDADGLFLQDPDVDDPISSNRSSQSLDVYAMIAGADFGAAYMPTPRQFTGAGGFDGGDVPRSDGASKRGYLITGSGDRKVRYWDLSGSMERSTVLTGLDAGSERPVFRTERESFETPGPILHVETSLKDVSAVVGPNQRTALISSHQQQLLRNHQDTVTALAYLDSPFRGGLISGDRLFFTTSISPNTLHSSSSANSRHITTIQTSYSTPVPPWYSYLKLRTTVRRHYIRTVNEANELIQTLDGPLGLDLEWRVTFTQPGVPMHVHPVALVQICDSKTILLIQLSAMQWEIPVKLKEILESANTVKTGVNIINDARKLFKDFSIKSRHLVELSTLASLADPSYSTRGFRKLASLATLVEAYTRHPLDKGSARMSNWEHRNLDGQQLRYAANDVRAGLSVYKRLMNLAALHGTGSSLIGAPYAVDLEDTLHRTRKKPPSPPASRSASTSIPNSSSDTTVLRKKSTTTSASRSELSSDISASQTEPIAPLKTPRPLQAYQLWHIQNLDLDSICAVMRTPENPLKRSTVGGYILKTIMSNRFIPFDSLRLVELLDTVSMIPGAPVIRRQNAILLASKLQANRLKDTGEE